MILLGDISFHCKAQLYSLLVFFLLYPSQAYAQQLGGGTAPDISFWRVFAAFAVSIGLGLCVLLALRMRNRGDGNLEFGTLLKIKAAKGAGDIKIVERCRIGPQSEILKVRCGETEYLIFSGMSHSTLLDSYPISDGQDATGAP